MSAETLNVAILAFDEVEALDFAGPYEVFTTASRMALREKPSGPTPFEVFSVARTRKPVRARAGLTLMPDHGFSDVAQVSERAQLTASVCTGAFVLAASGVLTDGPVTTHWEDPPDLARSFPALSARVAHTMVVALRRGPGDPELSPGPRHRDHMHPAVHRVQDAVSQEPQRVWDAQRRPPWPAPRRAT